MPPPDPTAGAAAVSAGSDYPAPPVLGDQRIFDWDDDLAAAENYHHLGRRLAACGDLYRRPGYAGGLLLAPPTPAVPPEPVATGKRLAAVLADRVRVRVVRDGKPRGTRVPAHHLDTMLASEVFLGQFRPVDVVARAPLYLPGFTPAPPGYHDGGPGHRVLYTGPEPEAIRSLDAITRFLDVMAFATPADRANAVAAALTVALRHLWPGAKPVVLVTSTKSHGGKGTVVDFATGSTPHVGVGYESTDWAFQSAVEASLRRYPETGVVHVDNARLGRGDRQIASAFLERTLTDPAPVLSAVGTGRPARIPNHLVVFVTTNHGTVSEDLMNRALPIHLAPTGDVADRRPAIGNPKLEYLPAHRGRIEAELRGMVAAWREAGSPADDAGRHPFSDWARTIGGILRVGGFGDFLANYGRRRTADDPTRRGLGVLGVSRPDVWLTAADWAVLATALGLVGAVVPEADRSTGAGRARGIGVTLTAHVDETFVAETDAAVVGLRLERRRARFGGEPQVRYRFAVVRTDPLPTEEVTGPDR